MKKQETPWDDLEPQQRKFQMFKRSSPKFYLLKNAKARAKLKSLECTITVNDFEIPEYCPCFGMRLEFGDKHYCEESPTLDRIDNAKGYVPGNVQVVSWKANRLKNNATRQDIETLLDWIKTFG
jgi:hypothetical protein